MAGAWLWNRATLRHAVCLYIRLHSNRKIV
jgi:hypothetical protein